MNEEQLKTRLYLMQSLDWILYVTVIVFGVYAFMYAENKTLMALLTVGGLLLVHWVGNYAFEKSAVIRVNLDILRRKRGNNKY